MRNRPEDSEEVQEEKGHIFEKILGSFVATSFFVTPLIVLHLLGKLDLNTVIIEGLWIAFVIRVIEIKDKK